MNKPTVSAQLLAALVAGAPPRVVKRLDAAPALAESWAWSEAAAGLQVLTDTGETVNFAAGIQTLAAVEQITCSCLLTPRCLHVLAVANVLMVSGQAAELGPAEQAPLLTESAEPTIALTPAQRQALGLARKAAERLLATGGSAAGAMGRAELLRAAHATRAEGLVRLAAGCAALADQLQALQTASPAFELPILCAQLAEVAAAIVQLERESVDAAWIGQARRAYSDAGHLQLNGLFCEPVSEGGQAGVITWLCDDQGRLYRRADVQPGPAERARQAYRHSTGLGDCSADHRQLSRSTVQLQGATSSADGRLGAGQGVKAVVVGANSWSASGPALRFAEPLATQLARAARASSEDRASSLLFLNAEILGVDGRALLLQAVAAEPHPGPLVRAFAPPGDIAAREALRALGCAPGQTIQCVARLRGLGRRGVDLLAVSVGPKAPPEWQGRANLGLDRLTPERAGASQSDVAAFDGGAENSDPFEPIRRRLGQLAMGGWSVLTPGAWTGVQREAAHLDAHLARFSARVLRAVGEVGPAERMRWFGTAWLVATGGRAGDL